MVKRGDQLLKQINISGNNSTAHELLTEFFRGYPIENLRLLFQSKNERAIRIGTWIASELGNMITPLINDISQLLENSSRFVRFFAIDAILVGATNHHGEVIAKTLLLIRDSDDAVRWKALCFLARATREQLIAGSQYLSDKDVQSMLIWLLDVENMNIDMQEVILKLDDKDPVARLFAVAATRRLSKYDRTTLEFAAKSLDPEISSFAKEELENLN